MSMHTCWDKQCQPERLIESMNGKLLVNRHLLASHAIHRLRFFCLSLRIHVWCGAVFSFEYISACQSYDALATRCSMNFAFSRLARRLYKTRMYLIDRSQFDQARARAARVR